MACNFSIKVNPIDDTNFECQWEGGKHTFTIYVDSSSTNNSYYIENEHLYNWFTIERNRNTLLVRVDPYYDYDNGKNEDDGGNPRTGYIRLIHNCDSTVTLDLTITQRGVPYQVVATENEITLPPLADSETKIEVKAYGGSEKFYVKSLKEYTNHTVMVNDTPTPVETDYDYGLKYTITEERVTIESVEQVKRHLIINSYGRTFVDEGYFYEITVAHRDYRFATDTIRVYYEEPTKKEISVSPKTINFDYHGNVTNDDDINYSTITLLCNGEEIPDYGYTYEFINENGKVIDESEITWLTVTANPTSLSFDCEQNCYTEQRNAYVKVYEYTDPDEDYETDEDRSSAIITITQDINENCSIVPSQSVITIPADVSEETYQTTFKVYGKSKQCSDASLEQGGDWIELISNPSTDDNGAYCLYTLYTLTFRILSENGGKDRTATIIINHADGASATITIIQLGIEQSEKGITTNSISNNTIIVTLNPAVENAQVTILSTGNWCKPSADVTYNAESVIATATITVTCEDNHWDTSRQCRLTLSNANNPNNNLNYTVLQKASSQGGTFVIQEAEQ